jgi:hypothetical protein
MRIDLIYCEGKPRDLPGQDFGTEWGEGGERRGLEVDK